MMNNFVINDEIYIFVMKLYVTNFQFLVMKFFWENTFIVYNYYSIIIIFHYAKRNEILHYKSTYSFVTNYFVIKASSFFLFLCDDSDRWGKK